MLQYPPFPLLTITKTSLKKLQTTQNRALRFATNQRYPHTKTTKQIHEENNMRPLNITLYTRAEKTHMNMINNLQLEEYINITENQPNYNHGWFKSSIQEIEREMPEPKYVL